MGQKSYIIIEWASKKQCPLTGLGHEQALYYMDFFLSTMSAPSLATHMFSQKKKKTSLHLRCVARVS